MYDVVFQGALAKLWVMLHAVSAIVLVGAATHQAVVTWGALRGRPRPRLARVYGAVIAVSYVATTFLGALAYPAFRVNVRGLYLDANAAWASNLFDIKEDFAALGLPLALGAWWLGRVATRAADPTSRPLPLSVVAVFGTAAIVWFGVVSGLLITLTRGV